MPRPLVHPFRRRGYRWGGRVPSREGSTHMADLAYALLLMGIFLLLALTLRGLERL
jgi:hypothetical protein